MKFLELEEKEFRAFLDQHPLKSFVQLPEMGTYKKNHGYDVYYVGLKEKNKIKCATMMVAGGNFFGKKSFYAPNGFLIDFEDQKLVETFTKEIKEFIKQKNGYTLIIDPYYPFIERDIDGNPVKDGFDHTNVIEYMKTLGYHYTGTTTQVKYMFVLDIKGKTKEQILSEMAPNVRRSIQKSLKKGITFRDLKKEELETFRTITSSSAERHQFVDQSLEYYQEIYDLFVTKGLARFVVSEVHCEEYLQGLKEERKKAEEELSKLKDSNGRKKDYYDSIQLLEKQIKEVETLQKEKGNIVPISASLFITYGEEVLYLFSGNLTDYMNLCTAYRIQWEMIQYATENHYNIYNFYGIMTTKKEEEGYGVYRFKRGFQGHVVELIGEFELPITKHYYMRKMIQKTLKR